MLMVDVVVDFLYAQIVVGVTGAESLPMKLA